MHSSSTVHKYPDFPRVAVSAIVWNGKKVLLVKRKNPPAKETWAPPGGSVRLGETCFDAVRRETLEETNLMVEPTRTVTHVDAIYRESSNIICYHYVILYIEAKLLGGDLKPGDDALDAGWFSKDDMSKMNVEAETLRILTRMKYIE